MTHLTLIGKEFLRNLKMKFLKMEEQKPHTQSQSHLYPNHYLYQSLLFLFLHL